MSAIPIISLHDSPVPYPGTYVWRAAYNPYAYHDGDTCWVERDTGCGFPHPVKLRLTGYHWKGFNADERFTPNGRLATERLDLICRAACVVRIETHPDPEDKYGRWLSPILIPAFVFTTALAAVVAIDPADTVTIDGVPYLDLAAHMVRAIPGCRWEKF
jgi:hypothetical protein